ncbi:UL16-binding protein 6-like [Meles meles]|uniref:UL16-binding protein 6-like n=1 Tax=Meles meles TaxID=9662 RepID=UPI001E69E4C3|nr:UL16-binding protein 6-like [Meles meles]
MLEPCSQCSLYDFAIKRSPDLSMSTVGGPVFSPNLYFYCFPFAAAPALSYNFSITSQPRPGPSWCEIQGQVNGIKFLSYACGNKEVKPVGPLGMKLKDTAFLGTQREPLKELGEELRKKLLDIKAEIFTESSVSEGPGQKENMLILSRMQGRLMCERGANRHTRGSWWFVFNEQLTHFFDPENRKWTVVLPGGQQFKGTLDNDEELTKLLVGTSNGDCKSWLQHVWEHWDETQATTGNSEDWIECWFS